MSEVEDRRGGRVQEHAVAAAAREERNGLVHARGLHAVRVVDPEHHLLAALVEASERFAAAENLLVRCEGESSGESPAVLAGGAREAERDRIAVPERASVRMMLGSGEHLARSIGDLDTKGIEADPQGAL